jgi:hypothetical protein
MPDEPNWRRQETYDYIDQLSPAGLAWEFLRRNADYRRDYDRLMPDTRMQANEALTAHWGLRFPDRSDPRRHRRRHLLDTHDRPGDADLRNAAGRPQADGLCPRD